MRQREIGIYMIQNKINDKIYIGRTKDFHKRIISHKSELNRKKHPSFILQRAWNKYGEDNFVFILFEKCSIDNYKEREQYWIDILKPKYNVSPSSNGGRYGRNTPETIEKSREAKRKIDIYQFDLYGKFIQKFRSGMDAARAVGAKDSDHIHDVCKGKRATAYGYIWNYTETPNFFRTRNKKVLQFDLQKNFIKEWNSIIDISRYYNIDKKTVSLYINNKKMNTRTILKNYIWH